MKIWFVLPVLWLCIAAGSALGKGPVWNRGRLYLMNGTVLEGNLNYNWKAEIVQVQQGDAIKAYSAFQVESFKYFDKVQNTIRRFVAFDYPIKATLHRPIFLEECATGPLMIYRRLRHQRDPIPIVTPTAFNTDEALGADVDNFTYYIVDRDTVHNLDEFTRDLWPRLCEEFGDELKRYVLSQQMDINNTMARLLLINQYNLLKLTAEPANPSERSAQLTGQ